MYIAVVVVLVPFLSLSCDTRVVRETNIYGNPPYKREKNQKKSVFILLGKTEDVNDCQCDTED